MKTIHFIVVCLAIALEGTAYCQSVITFDDISAVGFGPHSATDMPDGYQGFNWNNFAVFNTATFPQSGILNGTVSGPNVAVTPGSVPSSPPIISSISSSEPFVLISGYFTSAFLNGMNLEITGMNGTTTVFDQSYTLNVYEPSLILFPSSPVTEIDFAPSGGNIVGPNYLPGGSEMVLDNLTVAAIPEPSAGWLFGVGLGGAVWLRRKLGAGPCLRERS